MVATDYGVNGVPVAIWDDVALIWRDIKTGAKVPTYEYGHEVFYDGSYQAHYADTGNLVSAEPSRPCPRCGHCRLPGGEDACLGHMPGVTGACCGHGVQEGYVLYEDGTLGAPPMPATRCEPR